jgi:succinate dehydrogenase / fumarate reductase membrane anchor subunit
VVAARGAGTRDWLLQRGTAVVLAVYVLVLAGFFATHTPVTFEAWCALFAVPAMRVLTLAAVVAVVFHAWIGWWVVTTDYLRGGVRLLAQAAVLVLLAVCLVWGLRIALGAVG